MTDLKALSRTDLIKLMHKLGLLPANRRAPSNAAIRSMIASALDEPETVEEPDESADVESSDDPAIEEEDDLEESSDDESEEEDEDEEE